MPEAVNYIVYAIPVFFLLIGVELLIDKLKHTGYYRLNDALSNINAGITEQVTGAFLKTFVVGAYVWLYDHYRITEMPSGMWMWVILFIGVDFFYYWFHRLAHEINVLWGGHVVHHQSEEYNLSVALRQGAFQKFGSFLFYLPLAWIGFDPVMFIVISQIQTLYQFWIHTKTIHVLPAPVEYIFNTPSHHRVHHGRNPKYIDKNHGGTLIIWDRMFGTFQKEEEEVVYGITKPLQTWNPLRAQLDFWKDLFVDLRHSPGLLNKIKLLLMPPGWYPAALGGPQTPPPVDSQHQNKYDTRIPVRLNYYVFGQFVFALSITSWFLFSYEQMSAWANSYMVIYILLSITAIGLILEASRFAFITEVLRCAATVVLVLLLRDAGVIQHLTIQGIIGITMYAVLSILLFISLRKESVSSGK